MVKESPDPRRDPDPGLRPTPTPILTLTLTLNLFLSLLLLPGCAPRASRWAEMRADPVPVAAVAAPEAPAPPWTLSGDHPDYDRREFVPGLGRGPTTGAADNAARAEIAKVFEVRVRQQSSQSAGYTESASGDAGPTWERTAAVDDAIRTETERILKGVEIVARHAAGNGFVSLAVLSRRKASDGLAARAVDLAARADRLWDAAQASADPLASARSLWQATRALARLEAVDADLRVLAVRAPIDARIRSADASAAFRDRVRVGLPFGVAVDGRDADRLRTALISALTAAGVTVTRDAAGARVTLQGACEMRPNDRPPHDWSFVRYDLSLEARDGRSGTVLASLGPISDDASGTTQAQAFDRADYVIRARHVEPFVARLLERVFGSGEEER